MYNVDVIQKVHGGI